MKKHITSLDMLPEVGSKFFIRFLLDTDPVWYFVKRVEDKDNSLVRLLFLDGDLFSYSENAFLDANIEVLTPDFSNLDQLFEFD